MEEIIRMSAIEIIRRIKEGKVSVEEVASVFLQRIKTYNPVVNAIYELSSEKEILAQARQKDEVLKSGQKQGLLFGLPMTIKDSFLVKGFKNSNGDPLLRNYRAHEDAELVKRIKNAGAIIVGKTNVPLYCIDWQSKNFWNGRTNNPFNTSRVAGGSSGGSAAAVAAGFSPLELGADAGGSVRIPAHFNGICGLRPTENYLSNRGHLKAPNKPQGRRHIVTPGPIAKNVEDLMLLMEVLGDNLTNQLPELPAVDFSQSHWDQEPLKIAYAESINEVKIDEEYLAMFRSFIHKLRLSTHQLHEDHPVYDEKEAYLACNKLQGFEIGVNNPKFPLASFFIYLFIVLKYRDPLWAKGLAAGLGLTNTNYARVIDYKDQFSEIYQQFLTSYDIWITPVCCFEAFAHQHAGKPFIVNDKKIPYTRAIASYTFTTAFSGHPIVVIPIGKKQNGMPVGIQIHSRKWTDHRLLQIAKSFEYLTESVALPDIIDLKS